MGNPTPNQSILDCVSMATIIVRPRWTHPGSERRRSALARTSPSSDRVPTKCLHALCRRFSTPPGSERIPPRWLRTLPRWATNPPRSAANRARSGRMFPRSESTAPHLRRTPPTLRRMSSRPLQTPSAPDRLLLGRGGCRPHVGGLCPRRDGPCPCVGRPHPRRPDAITTVQAPARLRTDLSYV